MTLSAYFMSKSVFDVQGCRALTLALARLSCKISLHTQVLFLQCIHVELQLVGLYSTGNVSIWQMGKFADISSNWIRKCRSTWDRLLVFCYRSAQPRSVMSVTLWWNQSFAAATCRCQAGFQLSVMRKLHYFHNLCGLVVCSSWANITVEWPFRPAQFL